MFIREQIKITNTNCVSNENLRCMSGSMSVRPQYQGQLVTHGIFCAYCLPLVKTLLVRRNISYFELDCHVKCHFIRLWRFHQGQKCFSEVSRGRRCVDELMSSSASSKQQFTVQKQSIISYLKKKSFTEVYLQMVIFPMQCRFQFVTCYSLLPVAEFE